MSLAILVNLISNSAAKLLPISSIPLNSEELLYLKKHIIQYKITLFFFVIFVIMLFAFVYIIKNHSQYLYHYFEILK